MDEILVLAEHREGKIREITYEMLALANTLCERTNLKVSLLLLGDGSTPLVEDLKKACDTLLLMEAPELARYNSDTYLTALEKIMKNRAPRLTLMGHTAQGVDLAPALTIRTGYPLVTDCVDIDIASDHIKVRRQIYNGKISAQIVMKPSEGYIATLRPGSFSGTGMEKSAMIETIAAPDWANLRGRQFIEYIQSEQEGVDITSADILVSIGRGIGKPENMPIVKALADAIGATISCSRPVADKGWLPKNHQVGTSGKTVKPKIYIALGISGAFQHQAGMKNAETIIAVNSDPQAPIFGVAHYGIVGDLLQIAPVLAEKFKKTP
jgi:electron transfer flavoprotein alpha subunit